MTKLNGSGNAIEYSTYLGGPTTTLGMTSRWTIAERLPDGDNRLIELPHHRRCLRPIVRRSTGGLCRQDRPFPDWPGFPRVLNLSRWQLQRSGPCHQDRSLHGHRLHHGADHLHQFPHLNPIQPLSGGDRNAFVTISTRWPAPWCSRPTWEAQATTVRSRAILGSATSNWARRLSVCRRWDGIVQLPHHDRDD